MLLFQLIYKGKTARSLPNVYSPEDFCLSHNMKRWRNETETICLINDVLVPYIEKVKEVKALPHNQKSILIYVMVSKRNQQQKSSLMLLHRNRYATQNICIYCNP